MADCFCLCLRRISFSLGSSLLLAFLFGLVLTFVLALALVFALVFASSENQALVKSRLTNNG